VGTSARVAVRHVIEEYKRFLRTSFRFLDPHLREQFEAHLQQMDVLVRGPYVTLARDFERGAHLQREGWAVLQYWGCVILSRPDRCAGEIAETWRRRRTRSASSA